MQLRRWPVAVVCGAHATSRGSSCRPLSSSLARSAATSHRPLHTAPSLSLNRNFSVVGHYI